VFLQDCPTSPGKPRKVTKKEPSSPKIPTKSSRLLDLSIAWVILDLVLLVVSPAEFLVPGPPASEDQNPQVLNELNLQRINI
jgi:hypothetical protein